MNNRTAPTRFASTRQPSNGFSGVIGAGMTIKDGTITSTENTRIDGNVVSPVHIDGQLMISEGATVEGDVTANMVIVAGTVRGEVRAADVEIQDTGKGYGDIVTNNISTIPGAYIEGKLIMNQGELDESDPATFPESEVVSTSENNFQD